jgi:hypothetical protein
MTKTQISDPQPPPEQDNIPPEINKLISEDVLRARVQKISEAPKPKSPVWSFFDHQAFLIFLGFALTWGVGASLTSRWEASRLEVTRKIEQERRENDARIVAFNDFLGTVSEQHARASLVDHALILGAPLNQVATLIQSEHESFAKARSKTGILTFTIRELVPPQTYERIKTAVDRGLLKPLDGVIRTHDYMYYEALNHPKSVDWKNSVASTGKISPCSEALTHAIWYNAIAPRANDNASEQKKENSLKEMDESCKGSTAESR